MFKRFLNKFTSKELGEYSQAFSAVDGDTYFFNRHLKTKINPFLTGRLLEACAGVSTNYLEYPQNTVSTDINYKMLNNIVNSNMPVASDIQSLPFKDERFDSVLIVHGIHHIGDDKTSYTDYISPVVSEAHRVLRKGGRLIIVEGAVSHIIHLLLYACHVLIRFANRKVYYDYDFPLLYSRRVLDGFFPKNMFNFIHREKLNLPRSLYFCLEPMFCFRFRFPLILLPQRPLIYVLKKI